MLGHIHNHMMTSAIALAALLAAPAGAWAADAGAPAPAAQPDEQAATPEGLADIVVTAQRRSENLQRVPAAVTGLSSDAIANAQINSNEDLQFNVAGLTFGQQTGVARVNIRGIGLESITSGADASVAFHADGVYFARAAATAGVFYDIERIEVVRGPQGTLYGRNATGGSVNIIHQGPTEEFSGYARLTLGNYSRIGFEGAISGPIVPDRLLARVAVKTNDRDGFGKNLATGKDIDDQKLRSFRATLDWLPSDDLKVRLWGDYHTEDDNNYPFHYVGPGGRDRNKPASIFGFLYDTDGTIMPVGIALAGFQFGDPQDELRIRPPRRHTRDIYNNIMPINDRTFWGVGLDVTYDISDSVSFRSISSYRDTYWSLFNDLDNSEVDWTRIRQIEDAWQFSQELQLSGKTDRLTWLVGAFYFREKIRDGYFELFFPAFDDGNGSGRLFLGGSTDTDAYAAFSQVTYEAIDNLNFTVGARYSYEKRGVDHSRIFAPFGWNFTEQESEGFSAFTPKFGVDYTTAGGALLYATVSRGFKSGGFNLGGVPGAGLTATTAAYDPEKVWSYEVGFKNRFFDNRLQTNISAFYLKYTDLQVSKIENNLVVVENATNAKIKGVEAEITFLPVDGLTLSLTGNYLDATFDEFFSDDPTTLDEGTVDLKGNRLPSAPKFAMTFAPTYEFTLASGAKLSVRGEFIHQSKKYFTPFNRDNAVQVGHQRYNANIGFDSANGRWSIDAYIRNITNAVHFSGTVINTEPVGFTRSAYLEEPRTYGVTLGFKF